MYRRKSWREKFGSGDEKPHIVKSERNFADVPAGSTMLIATPKIVADYIQQIPKGKTGSLKQMLKDLAATYHADYMCPVTAGIFLRIAAEAAYEEYTGGKALNKITPFWRMIDNHSPALKKLTCGKDFVLDLRKKEGIDAGKHH